MKVDPLERALGLEPLILLNFLLFFGRQTFWDRIILIEYKFELHLHDGERSLWRNYNCAVPGGMGMGCLIELQELHGRGVFFLSAAT